HRPGRGGVVGPVVLGLRRPPGRPGLDRLPAPRRSQTAPPVDRHPPAALARTPHPGPAPPRPHPPPPPRLASQPVVGGHPEAVQGLHSDPRPRRPARRHPLRGDLLMHAMSARYLDDGLLLTTDEAWGWWRLGLVPYEFLDDPAREALAAQIATTLAGLGATDGHLVVARRRHDPLRWADQLRAQPGATPAWAPYVQAMRGHVQRRAFDTKEVYLGIRLGDRKTGGAGGWRRRLEAAAGVADPTPTSAEIDRWRRTGELAGRVLEAGFAPRLASTAELAWLIRRSFWRGIGEPPPLAAAARRAGAAVEVLAEGVVHNGRRDLRLAQEAGSAYVAALAFARFPDALAFPGGEWLAALDTLPFPVDASVRFTVVPPRVAAKHAARKLAEATDQARHIARTSCAIPLALTEAAERASGLEYALHKERMPLLYCWPRLLVAAPEEQTLSERVVEVVEWYRDAGLDVVRPAGDQLALLIESIPGETVRVKAYQQRQAPITLAGAMATATTTLGDGTGP